jgi:hypothetical protein
MSIGEIAELLTIEDLSESTYIEIKKAMGGTEEVNYLNHFFRPTAHSPIPRAELSFSVFRRSLLANLSSVE